MRESPDCNMGYFSAALVHDEFSKSCCNLLTREEGEQWKKKKLICDPNSFHFLDLFPLEQNI